MTDATRTSTSGEDLAMNDPADREIHQRGAKSPYPASPKGERELYTDGGDVEDSATHTTEDQGAFEGAHDEGLKGMSEAEYKAWKEGRE